MITLKQQIKLSICGQNSRLPPPRQQSRGFALVFHSKFYPFYIRSTIIIKRGSQQEAPYILRVCRLKRNHWNLIGRKKKMVIFSGIEMREGELLGPKMAAAPFFFWENFLLEYFWKGNVTLLFLTGYLMIIWTPSVMVWHEGLSGKKTAVGQFLPIFFIKTSNSGVPNLLPSILT